MKKNEKIRSIINDKDVFGNSTPFNEAYSWPLSRGGTNIKDNLIKLSAKSKNQKKSKTKGKINGIRFRVDKIISPTVNGEQLIYGKLHIWKDGKWYEVIAG